MKIGFIGLGNVGGKLAESLFRNQFDLIVHDSDKDVADSFKSKGIKISNSPGELTIRLPLLLFVFIFGLLKSPTLKLFFVIGLVTRV